MRQQTLSRLALVAACVAVFASSATANAVVYPAQSPVSPYRIVTASSSTVTDNSGYSSMSYRIDASDYPSGGNVAPMENATNQIVGIADLELDPTRTKLAITVGNGNGGVRDLAGGPNASIGVNGCGFMRWSPDGHRVACRRFDSVYLADATLPPVDGFYQGSHFIHINVGSPYPITSIGGMDWSGNDIIISGRYQSFTPCWERTGLWRVNATTGVGSAIIDPCAETSRSLTGHLAVSPDGKSAFWVDNSTGQQPILVDLTTGAITDIPTGTMPTIGFAKWESDGSAIMIAVYPSLYPAFAPTRIERLDPITGARMTIRSEDHPDLVFTTARIADTLPPVVTGTADRAPNEHGWYRNNVTVAWTATDPAPSSGGVANPPATTAAGEGFGLVVTSAPACDARNNCATGTFTLNIDRTAPGVVINGPTEGAHVPQGSYTALACVASDALSGLDGQCEVTVTSASGSPGVVNYTATVTATDKAGNTTSVVRRYSVILDGDGPMISWTTNRQPNAAGWFDGPVTYTFTCADPSGVATCPPPHAFTADGANQSIAVSAADVYGNGASFTLSGVNVDGTAPVVQFSGNQGTYTPDQLVAITCSSSDATSGVLNASCPTLQGTVNGLLPVGDTTLTATATDLAGHTTTVATAIHVVVTKGSIVNLISQFLPSGQPGNTGIANALAGKVLSGNYQVFLAQINAQCCSPTPGKRLTQAQVNSLTAYVAALP